MPRTHLQPARALVSLPECHFDVSNVLGLFKGEADRALATTNDVLGARPSRFNVGGDAIPGQSGPTPVLPAAKAIIVGTRPDGDGGQGPSFNVLCVARRTRVDTLEATLATGVERCADTGALAAVTVVVA